GLRARHGGVLRGTEAAVCPQQHARRHRIHLLCRHAGRAAVCRRHRHCVTAGAVVACRGSAVSGHGADLVGYLAWNVALRRVSASQLSSFLYFSPPIAVLIGWLWLGERPGLLTLVGGVITVAGVALANARRRTAPGMVPGEPCEQH